MPSWKKVIISGSNAELASLYAPSITGSLQGTASFAVSASRALTSSFVTGSNVFGPYGANSIVSASYATTSSLSDRTTRTDLLVINQSGFTINKGIVVRITGSNNASDIPRITTASYTDDNNSANTLGIASEQITNGSQGYVITEGVLTGLDTTGWASGTLLFLGLTGSITASAPQAPLHAVRLGQVIREQSVNGSMHVRIDNGYEIGELHDVADNTTNSSFGDLLVKSGSVWTNSRQLSGSYGLTGSLEVRSNGANGIILEPDIAGGTNSSRLFFVNSAANTDISLRNNNGSLFIGHSATAGASSGPYIMIISGSAIAIGNNYTISAGRNALLQVSGSVNIEEGFAYKQDSYDILYATRGNTGTSYDNIIGGVYAASGSVWIDQMTSYGYYALAESSGSAQTAYGYAAGRLNTGSNQT